MEYGHHRGDGDDLVNTGTEGTVGVPHENGHQTLVQLRRSGRPRAGISWSPVLTLGPESENPNLIRRVLTPRVGTGDFCSYLFR